MSLIKSTKNRKRIIYTLILMLVVVSGLVFSFAQFAFGLDVNREIKNETTPSPKPLSIADRKANLDKRKKWEVSPEGKKIHASHDKIKQYIKDFSNMEAVVTSVTFQRENAKSSGPKWLIVRINGEDYMMQYIPKDFEQLKSLKVNDKIIVKSRSAGYSPNHPYLILSGDYIARKNTILSKRDFSKNNPC